MRCCLQTPAGYGLSRMWPCMCKVQLQCCISLQRTVRYQSTGNTMSARYIQLPKHTSKSAHNCKPRITKSWRYISILINVRATKFVGSLGDRCRSRPTHKPATGPRFGYQFGSRINMPMLFMLALRKHKLSKSLTEAQGLGWLSFSARLTSLVTFGCLCREFNHGMSDGTIFE
jgi:hypothetical protein